jgi:hypothetical protein
MTAPNSPSSVTSVGAHDLTSSSWTLTVLPSDNAVWLSNVKSVLGERAALDEIALL